MGPTPKREKTFLTGILLPFGLAWAGLLLISFLYRRNALLTALLLPVAAALVWEGEDRRFRSAFALFAALLGLFGEWACTRAGMWVYANPSFLRLPLWLPLAWVISMTAFLSAGEYLDHAAEKLRPRARALLLLVLRLAVLSYLVIVVLYLRNYVGWTLLGFVVAAAPLLRRPLHTLLFAIAAAMGFWAEYQLVRAGVWHYARPGLGALRMPVSLPIAWGISADLIWLMARAVAGVKIKAGA